MDSGLEAFSRTPTHDSFSPLAVQLSDNTKYENQRCLSYYVDLLLGSLRTTDVSVRRVGLAVKLRHARTLYD